MRLRGGSEQSFGKQGKPACIRVGYRQRQRHPARPPAHGGDVGKIDGNGSIAHVEWWQVLRIMRAGDNGIDGADQFAARLGIDQGGVIADAESNAFIIDRPIEEAANQSEFVHRESLKLLCRCACFSGSQLVCRFVEDGIDVLVPVHGTEALGKVDRFVNHDPVWHVLSRPEFKKSE